MAGKRPATPDDIVFYALYPLNSVHEHGKGKEKIEDEVGCENNLLRLRAQCLETVLPLVNGYIWQHQPFDLALYVHGAKCLCSIPPVGPGDEHIELSSTYSSSSVPHLHGKVKYGDNIEDEWFVVYLLVAISKKLPDIAIRVWDTDGEFLLIEAAYTIPRWLKPENSWNRVFIKQGRIHILPIPSSPAELYDLPIQLCIEDAVRLLSNVSLQTVASEPVQQVVQRRLQSFGEDQTKNMHNAVCRVPLRVAQVLKHDHQLVALAVAAFYDRDLDSMKAASQMQQFLGHGQVEMVDVVVRMSRAMYAQLMQQVFQSPRCYPMPPLSDPHFKEAELGMKLACGFEMMYWEGTSTGSLQSDGVLESPAQVEMIQQKDIGWQFFLASLQHSGYFKGLLEGCKEYCQLMDQAMKQYKSTSMFSRASAPIQRIKEILALPHTVQEFAVSKQLKSDDDAWLYNGEEDLKSAMLERKKEMDTYEFEKVIHKKAAASKPEDVAKSMHSFFEKVSTFEGAELPNDDNVFRGGDDDAISLSMGRFLTELKSAFGSDMRLSDMHMEGMLPEENFTSSSDIDFEDSDSDDYCKEEVKDENCPRTSLRHDLENTSKGLKRKKIYDQANYAFMEEYSEALSKELNTSNMAKSFVEAETSTVATGTKGTVDGNEELPPVNIDVNMLENLLQSFSAQHGLPGPASNLLGAMGLHLPDGKDQN